MIIPYPYQDECLGCIAKARSLGSTRASVVMATRLGKTIMAAFDVKRFLLKPKSRLLYLCHKTDILYQARTEFEMVIGHERSYGFLHGKEKNFHEVNCLFSSFETMRNYIDLFDPDEFDYIIVDESHHSPAETYLPVISHFRPKFLLGITATPNRMDLQDISEIYGKPVFELPLEKALGLGYLTPLDYRVLTDEIQTEEVLKTPDKLWSISALNHQIFVPKRDEEIARIIALHTSKIENPKTMIFCSSVKHCDHLVKFIPDSLAIHSKIPQKERDVRLEMFRQNMLNTVITVDCFNEGIDIPRANVIVFLRSTASATIFLQQLGRGLTKTEGKDKVIILDFVANIERIRTVQDMHSKVMEYMRAQNTYRPIKDGPPPIMLEVGKVLFQERKISLTDLLERIVKKEFYLTWQEASRAAIALRISSKKGGYNKKHRLDPKLPSNPSKYYPDYPGDSVFFGRKKRDFYPTLAEATLATKKLGAKSVEEYVKLRVNDERLPRCPDDVYQDFPGWNLFLGTNKYPTWQEASVAVIEMGIKSWREYRRRFKEDNRLPAAPHLYKGYPGVERFFGREDDDMYANWRQASRAAIKLGITSREMYLDVRKQDPRLPSDPWKAYPGFPSWGVFLKTGRQHRAATYKTWRQASRAARKMGITSKEAYAEAYKKNKRLPSSPPSRYDDFPGWPKFLGKV